MDQTKSLNKFIYKLEQPCVFKDMLKQKQTTSSCSSSAIVNSACSWTPKLLAKLFKDTKLTFRIGKKNLPKSKNWVLI